MKKIISAILAALMLTGAVTVSAEPFITVSSWAYNDVSNFRTEILMPESLGDITDYTQNINRLQFAELIYSALDSLGETSLSLGDDPYDSRFADIKNAAATELKWYGIMVGEPTGATDEDEYRITNFFPDRLLTREEMAAVIYRAAWTFRKDILNFSLTLDEQKTPDDINAVSQYARTPVTVMYNSGLIAGTDTGDFLPQDNLTIEQAIAVVYRFYQAFPTATEQDGAGVPVDGEFTVQTYENGLTETRNGNVLYLKDGGKTLMEFETDIYYNIYSATADGVIYAAAQNCYSRTDVYNAETGELLFRIPLPVYAAKADCIITKSTNRGSALFGVYDYAGNEILSAEYSMQEIDVLAENNFEPYEASYREPEGWTYYTGTADIGGGLYKVDSNGENNQKILDKPAGSTEYAYGWLYYDEACIDGDIITDSGNSPLHAVRSDGKYDQKLTENNAGLIYPDHIEYNEKFGFGTGGYSSLALTGNDKTYMRDGYVYYIDSGSTGIGEPMDNRNGAGTIWRVKMNDDGTAVKEQLSDVPVRPSLRQKGSDIQENNGDLYFINYGPVASGRLTSLYRFDGSEVKMVSGDFNISSFGFSGDKLVMIVHGQSLTYIAEPDGSNPTPWDIENDDITGNIYSGVYGSEVELGVLEEEVSDNNFKIYRSHNYVVDHMNHSGSDYYEPKSTGLYLRRGDGYTQICSDEYLGRGYARIDDTLYYIRNTSDNLRQKNTLYAYDLATGNQREIASGVECVLDKLGDSVIRYQDYTGNIWRYDAERDEIKEISPNKGIIKYGELLSIRTDSGVLFKIDTDGNCSKLADNADFAIYVPNGSDRPAMAGSSQGTFSAGTPVVIN